jgi:uncharacterized membrane protein HdeD (DUF308 family)
MVQLALLLLGAQAVQRHWLRLAVVGVLWTTLGLVVTADPLDGIHAMTMHALGALLVVEGVVTLLSALLSEAAGRLRVVRAFALIVPGLLIVETPWRNFVLISVLFGLALTVDGAIRIVPAPCSSASPAGASPWPPAGSSSSWPCSPSRHGRSPTRRPCHSASAWR